MIELQVKDGFALPPDWATGRRVAEQGGTKCVTDAGGGRGYKCGWYKLRERDVRRPHLGSYTRAAEDFFTAQCICLPQPLTTPLLQAVPTSLLMLAVCGINCPCKAVSPPGTELHPVKHQDDTLYIGRDSNPG